MVVIIILVVLAGVGGAVFWAMSKKGDDGTGVSRPAGEHRPRLADLSTPTDRSAAPRPTTAPTSLADADRSTPASPAASVEAGLDEPDDEEEPDLSRFGVPTAKPASTPARSASSGAVPFRYPMEGTPAPTASEPEPAPEPEPEPTVEASPEVVEVVAVEPEPVVEPSPQVVAVEPEPVVEPAPEVVAVESEPTVEPEAAEVVALAPEPEPEAEAEPAAAEASDAAEESNTFDLDKVLVAPLFGSHHDDDDVPDGPTATITRLEPRTEREELPLAEIVADLIDAADPEVAEVMARLIDSSDPQLVARLVDADDLEVAQVVAELLDAADDEVRAMVMDLADAPDRRQVAEVLRLVDAAYSGADALLSPELVEQLEELDVEADLELTSRPAEMAQFARLDNKDQLRVIIRVLCGLVARDDLPRSPRMPASPASAAEQRRWPLSRARWPVPPPAEGGIVKRAPLPARRTDTVAS